MYEVPCAYTHARTRIISIRKGGEDGDDGDEGCEGKEKKRRKHGHLRDGTLQIV